jgi:hypothetical protein
VALQRFGLLFLTLGPTMALAQPAMSRGQQQLGISYNECLNRARAALQGTGFSVGGSGNYAQGFRESSGAYIICNDAPGGGTIVNIVVATNTNDAGVPGGLRQMLQAQMEKPAGSPPPGAGSKVWVSAGVGDCSGSDGGQSDGSAPDPSKAQKYPAAICWDGKKYNNAFTRSGQAFCTYKTIPAAQCSGGGNPGVKYSAVPR